MLFRDAALNTAGQTVAKLGEAACALAALGLASTLHKGGGDREDFLLAWPEGAGGYLLDYVYRFIAVRLYGENLAAFTPSRWMTVMSYPLSIYAGSGLALVHRAVRRVAGRLARLKFDFALAALVAAMAAAAIPTSPNCRRGAYPSQQFSTQPERLGRRRPTMRSSSTLARPSRPWARGMGSAPHLETIAERADTRL